MLNDVTTLRLLLLLSVVLGLIGWIGMNFLGRELLKKFLFDTWYLDASQNQSVWDYKGAHTIGGKPKMWNIVLRSNAPFTAKIGFTLTLRGGILKLVSLLTLHNWGKEYSAVDYYGQASAKRVDGRQGEAVMLPGAQGTWEVVFSTYAGSSAAEFIFETDCASQFVEIVADESVQHLEADSVSPPHWYQEWFDNFWG